MRNHARSLSVAMIRKDRSFLLSSSTDLLFQSVVTSLEVLSEALELGSIGIYTVGHRMAQVLSCMFSLLFTYSQDFLAAGFY